MFGNSGEYFAMHLIKGKPNHDAIASVQQPYSSQAQICKARYCPDSALKFVEDVKLPLTLSGPILPDPNQTALIENATLGDFFNVMTKVEKVIYVEQSDLAN